MYKIDDEFRPRGRVFMKATRETNNSSTVEQHQQQNPRNVVPVPVRKSSLKKGPAITTNLDDRSIQFQHEVTHEKSVEALVTEYPPHQQRQQQQQQQQQRSANSTVTRFKSSSSGGAPGYDVPDGAGAAGGPETVLHSSSSASTMQEITRNKRTATEILGSSYESKKLSQRAADGHRSITTHVVRKMTTLSRAEESAHAQNLVQTAHNQRTTEFGYMTTQAIEPPSRKVHMTKSGRMQNNERRRRNEFQVRMLEWQIEWCIVGLRSMSPRWHVPFYMSFCVRHTGLTVVVVTRANGRNQRKFECT